MTDKPDQPEQNASSADSTGSSPASQDLRHQAERILRYKTARIPADLETMPPEEIRRTLHELQVHQIELELQNEELRQVQLDLDVSRMRYFDLYDLAPAGYLTLSGNGLIQEANLTAVTLLGLARGALLNKPFTQFILDEDQDIYYLNRTQNFETGEPKVCELRLVKQDGTPFWVHLAITALQQASGAMECCVVISDIVERKRTEEALRESEERYRLLFESASDAQFLITNDTGHIIDANGMTSELYGYDRDELLTRKCGDLSATPEEHCRIIHELRTNPDGIVNIPLHLHRRKDGTVFPVETTARSLPMNGQQVILVAVRDITERRQAEEALRQSEQNTRDAKKVLELVLDTIPVRLFWKDLNSVYLGCNRLFAQDAGCRFPEELIGTDDYRLGWVKQADMYRQDDFEIMSSGKPKLHYEEPQTTADGKQKWLSTSKVPLRDAKGKIMGLLGAYEDITQRKWAEEQLKAAKEDLERRVEQRTRELQETQKQFLHAEKLSAIGTLSASIAHEFNNPLQAIQSILKGLKKRAILEEEDRELLDAAISESERIKELIRSLQDFNRPSSGKKTFVDVHQSLDSILLLLKSDFNKKRISVVRNYAEQLPQILAVPDQIKQVFLNLLANAADACHRSGGEITVSTRRENKQVAVAIKDTGIGMKLEEIEHIFRPFYTTKPEVKGTGLGLSVSYGIVKNHQGEIRVDSRPGEGATFTVLLPIKGGCDTVSASGQ